VGSLKTISPKSTGGYYAGLEGGGIGLGWFCSKTPNLNERFVQEITLKNSYWPAKTCSVNFTLRLPTLWLFAITWNCS